MSLDHDLENLPRLSDEDREALEDPRPVVQSVPSSRLFKATKRSNASSQQSNDNENLATRVEKHTADIRKTLFNAMALVSVSRDALDATDHCELRIVLTEAYDRLETITDALEEITSAIETAAVRHE